MGENLYMTSEGSKGGPAVATVGCNKWYKETKFYSYPGNKDYQKCDKGKKFSKYGHLTQVLS